MANLPQNNTYGKKQPQDENPVAGAARMASRAARGASAGAAGPLRDMVKSRPPAPAPAPMPEPAPPQGPLPAPQVAEAPPFDASGMGNTTTLPGTPTRGEEAHPGLDIAGQKEQTIPAFQPGTVTEAKQGGGNNGGYGNYVVITDAYGNKHRYSHLNRVWVKIGDRVGQGMPIGAQGNSGNTYSPSGQGDGSHLDYRVADLFNRYVDPTRFVKPPAQQQ